MPCIILRSKRYYVCPIVWLITFNSHSMDRTAYLLHISWIDTNNLDGKRSQTYVYGNCAPKYSSFLPFSFSINGEGHHRIGEWNEWMNAMNERRKTERKNNRIEYGWMNVGPFLLMLMRASIIQKVNNELTPLFHVNSTNKMNGLNSCMPLTSSDL